MATEQAGPVDRVIGFVRSLLLDPKYFWHLAGLVILGDTILTQLIILFVPFTEIDYETYMAQMAVFDKGELDYEKITGPTGPVVYPAGYIWIHWVLRYLTVRSDESINVALGQQIYAGLYLFTVFMTCLIYRQSRALPNYAIIPLILSKRLHSIFVLRLFNDCWAVAGALVAVWAYGRRSYMAGTIFYSFALSVKMNLLLYLPGILVVLIQGAGIQETALQMILLVGIQAYVGMPFLTAFPWPYLKNSFDFSRQFLYVWTANWRMVPEEYFLSQAFATALLVGQALLLIAFGWKWCQPEGGFVKVVQRALINPGRRTSAERLASDRIVTILFTSNLIGMIFARSLHFQFYSWYAQQLPFLVFHTKFSPLVNIGILGAIEYTWNVFPSTEESSSLMLVANSVLLYGIWSGYPNGKTAIAVPPVKKTA